MFNLDVFTAEVVTSLHLKYCVDPEWIDSSVCLGLLDGFSSYAAITDNVLQTSLDNNSEKSKDAFTFDTLDTPVSKELSIYMFDLAVKSCRISLCLTSLYCFGIASPGLSMITRNFRLPCLLGNPTGVISVASTVRCRLFHHYP